MASASGTAAAAPAAASSPAVVLQLMHYEFMEYLLKSCVDTRAGREDAFGKMERVGYEAGRRLAERLTMGVDKKLTEQVDIMLFLCRDVWTAIFGHQVSKLQTNNKGVWMMVDQDFDWFSSVCAPSGHDTAAIAQKYLSYPCGLVRGVLAALGVDGIVHAEISKMPICTFHIRTKV